MLTDQDKPPRGVFVTGTDTEVGKTFFSSKRLRELRAQGLHVGAYKPAASGAPSIQDSDAYHLWSAIGKVHSIDWVNPQSFAAPLAPPIAAELEGKTIDDQLIFDGVRRWRGYCDFLLVEGAGGLLSPISWQLTNADIARQIGYPLWILAPNRLGVVHQILATVSVAIQHGLAVEEVVLNDVHPTSNDEAAQNNQRLLAPFLKRLSPETTLRRSLFQG
ncbi:MAG: dethiobiotin synthase [Pirellula sp.]